MNKPSLLARLKNYFIPHHGNDYKPHSVRIPAITVILAVSIFAWVFAFFGSVTISKKNLLADVRTSLLVMLTNEDRKTSGVGELTVNPLLTQAAEMKAQDMIDNNYFAHTSPTGTDPWFWFKKAGYHYKYAGENLAIDFYDTEQVQNAWMNSPTHKKNILNGRYKEIGIATKTGTYHGRQVAFVVEMFGTSSSVTPTTALANIPQVTRQQPTQTPLSEPKEPSQVLGEETVAPSEIATIAPETNPQESFSDFIESTPPVETLQPSEKMNFWTKIKTLIVQLGRIGTIVIGLLFILVSFSLILKIGIEYKRQHYKNIIAMIVVLGILFVLYFSLMKSLGHVVIL